jgi:hypothetical protein
MKTLQNLKAHIKGIGELDIPEDGMSHIFGGNIERLSGITAQ